MLSANNNVKSKVNNVFKQKIVKCFRTCNKYLATVLMILVLFKLQDQEEFNEDGNLYGGFGRDKTTSRVENQSSPKIK